MAELRIYEEFITHDDIVEPQVSDEADGDEDERVDVIDGPVGSASLKQPAEVDPASDEPSASGR
jgi:hypothetical protein